MVYLWVDGIYVKAGLEKEKAVLLVVLAALSDGSKAVVSVTSGYRESTQSWSEVLRDLKGRGMGCPRLVIGDGHLGIWGALRNVYPQAEEQRCWNHRIVNLLTKLPKRVHKPALLILRQIPYAETREEAQRLKQVFQHWCRQRGLTLAAEPPYMQPSHPSAPVQMRTGSLQLLSSLPQQPLPSLSPDAPPIRIHRFLPLPVSSPASLPSPRFAHIAAQSHRIQVHHPLRAVIPLVRPPPLRCLVPSGSACSTFSAASVRVFHHGLRVPSIGSLYRHRDNRSGLQIHCMLRLVRQVRPPVLHSGNPRIRIMRVLPNPVRSFARALAVQFGQIFPSRRLNPGGFRQLHQKLFIPLLAVPAHDAAQRCIRFQRSGIDADRLAPQQAAPPRSASVPSQRLLRG